jgi:hypothetical protein
MKLTPSDPWIFDTTLTGTKVIKKEDDDRLTGTRQLRLHSMENLGEEASLRFALFKEMELKTAWARAIIQQFRWFWTYHRKGYGRQFSTSRTLDPAAARRPLGADGMVYNVGRLLFLLLKSTGRIRTRESLFSSLADPFRRRVLRELDRLFFLARAA